MSTLQLTTLAQQKLRAYIDNCEYEISGLGKAEHVENGFRVLDVKIFKQDVSGAHTEIDSEALGSFLYDLTKEGEDASEWVLWWHSHARMSAFFSGTDDTTIRNSSEMPYLLSLVGNHKGEWEARFDSFKPMHATAGLEVVLLGERNQEIIELCKQEIQELVSERYMTAPMAFNQQRIPHKEVLTKRQQKIIKKANNGEGLTDTEMNEILPYYADICDNNHWSEYPIF